jgi:hypothetical protein
LVPGRAEGRSASPGAADLYRVSRRAPSPLHQPLLRGGPEKTTAPRLVAGGLSVADCVWGVSRRCIGRRVAEAGEAVRCKRTQNGCDRRGYPG